MKILLGSFKDNGEELASFLEPRIGAKPSLSGGELTVEDDSLKEGLRSRHVKTYVKRFLFKKGERKNYKVLVEGKELRLVLLEGAEEEEEEEEEKEKKPKEEETKEKETASNIITPSTNEGRPEANQGGAEGGGNKEEEAEKTPPAAQSTPAKKKKGKKGTNE